MREAQGVPKWKLSLRHLSLSQLTCCSETFNSISSCQMPSPNPCWIPLSALGMYLALHMSHCMPGCFPMGRRFANWTQEHDKCSMADTYTVKCLRNEAFGISRILCCRGNFVVKLWPEFNKVFITTFSVFISDLTLRNIKNYLRKATSSITEFLPMKTINTEQHQYNWHLADEAEPLLKFSLVSHKHTNFNYQIYIHKHGRLENTIISAYWLRVT